MVMEVQATNFERLGSEPNIETVKSPTPAYTELAFNLCPPDKCPDAEFNPAVQDRDVRQAIAYAIDRERINTIAARETSYPAHGILPEFYKSFYEQPDQDYPLDVDRANQILDDAGWVMGDDGVREKDGERLEFDLYVRSESPYNIQAAKLVAEQTAPIGVKFNVQVVSVDKLTDLTIRKVDGKPAPDFDTFIWGWGGDPYDPSFLLSLFLSTEIGGLSDSFYDNPEYDKLFAEQAGTFDVAERKAIIKRMVDLTQRDLPYIVLTYDPNLQAYRTDTVANVEPACPADGGDIICEQVGYAPLLDDHPGRGERLRRRRRPVGRPRGRRGDRLRLRRLDARAAPEPATRARAARAAGVARERTLARGQVGGGAADPALRARLQLLPLPGHGRSDHPARAAAAARARLRSRS